MISLKAQSPNLEDYLKASPVIQSDHPAISGQAQAIIGTLIDESQKARVLFEWVRDEISHSYDAKRREISCSSLEVLENGTGLCYAKAHLLAALMRSAGIPCGFCYQTFDERGSLHGLNGIFLTELNKWIHLDPRGNSHGADQSALFDLENDVQRLAFPNDPFIGNVVYAAPLPQVVSSLSIHSRVDVPSLELPTIG